MTQDDTPELASSRRASRRKTNSKYGANFQSSQHVPSAVHYVGYVEEDETPEMIMAKFQELEEIQRKASAERERVAEAGDKDESGAAGDEVVNPSQENQLTDEQLLQVFKQTSMFNVKTALQDNAVLAGIDELLEFTNERYGDDEIMSDDEDMLRSFWSDDEDWDDGARRRKRGKGAGDRKKGLRRGGVAQPKVRHRVVTAYNPTTQALVRKKVKVADPNEIQYIRVPNPLPLSWGRTIAPFKKPVAHQPRGIEDTLEKTVAEAILVNEAWYQGCDANGAMKRLSAVAFEKLVPYGFIFVWTPKELVHPVCKLMLKKGFAYIENLTWVWMEPNNTIAENDSEYVRRSHLTLYMFRAICGDRSKVELRHQRSPDVIFDYRKDGGRCPQETYEYLETLLPQSTKEGKLVEIFGSTKHTAQRPGWKVVEYNSGLVE
jgi:N6-adenosine-specific RNA methylase IME4